MDNEQQAVIPATNDPYVFHAGQGSGGNLLSAGDYPVVITFVERVNTTAKGFNDSTPQIKVTYRELDGSGTFSQWYNMIGYQTDENGYVFDQTGMRIIDAEKTKAAREIFERVAFHANVNEGEAFAPEDIVGGELGISIAGNDRNNMRVKNTMFLADMAEMDKAAEVLNTPAAPAPPVVEAPKYPHTYEALIANKWDAKGIEAKYPGLKPVTETAF